ncbi:MAG TPA: methyl-accepting chemotaxis protein, partial [Candidatus Acidoferrum sp.]|nr:methyl-accepting chemotaxis protein [Candidatus Acidoferrum sp.]
MKNVRDFSIRTKLSLMIILTSVITMLIACFILTISDRSQSRERLAKDLNNLADIIVANSTSAVSFDDEKAAREALTSLGAYEQISGALILKSDGKPFASYGRKQAEQLPATLATQGSGCHFQDDWVDCVQEMRVDGKLIGTLVIRSDLRLLAERLRWFMTISALIVLLTSILAVIIGEYLQRMISRPIGEISRIAEAVAVGDILQDIRLTQADEIGKLAESFRKIISYMKHLASASERIAANDLTVRIEPKSERDLLGNSFRTMLANLNSMIRQLAENANQLVEVASQIASSSEEMSKGAKEQADQINQVSSAVEEMTAVIQESSQNASAAAQVASGSCDTATSGGQVVSDTIHGMQRIAQVVRDSSESIAQLAKSADQIGEISSVIDDIADQTNLLALNAAIEAARA